MNDWDQYRQRENYCFAIEYNEEANGATLIQQIMFYPPSNLNVVISPNQFIRELCLRPVPEILKNYEFMIHQQKSEVPKLTVKSSDCHCTVFRKPIKKKRKKLLNLT